MAKRGLNIRDCTHRGGSAERGESCCARATGIIGIIKRFVHMMDDVYTKSQSIRYIGDKTNANKDSALVADQEESDLQ